MLLLAVLVVKGCENVVDKAGLTEEVPRFRFELFSTTICAEAQAVISPVNRRVKRGCFTVGQLKPASLQGTTT